MLHDVSPFNNCYHCWITGDLGQFIGNDAGLVQPVEIKMVNLVPGRLVHLADSKRRAADNIGTARTACQTPGECCLAATQVTCQLDCLAAAQRPADFFGEMLGGFGTGGIYLQCRYGTHMRRIVARKCLQPQVPLYATGCVP